MHIHLFLTWNYIFPTSIMAYIKVINAPALHKVYSMQLHVFGIDYFVWKMATMDYRLLFRIQVVNKYNNGWRM